MRAVTRFATVNNLLHPGEQAGGPAQGFFRSSQSLAPGCLTCKIFASCCHLSPSSPRTLKHQKSNDVSRLPKSGRARAQPLPFTLSPILLPFPTVPTRTAPSGHNERMLLAHVH